MTPLVSFSAHGVSYSIIHSSYIVAPVILLGIEVIMSACYYDRPLVVAKRLVVL